MYLGRRDSVQEKMSKGRDISQRGKSVRPSPSLIKNWAQGKRKDPKRGKPPPAGSR